MDEKILSPNTSAEPTQDTPATDTTASGQSTNSSTQRAGSEHRQVYGTAKTEDLRDSGLWRIILPTVVGLFCLTLFVVPLLILIPLLINSIMGIINHDQQEAQLLWIWITMIVIEVAVWIIIAYGLLKAFMTQAGNYAH
jgi:ABC-type sulfate transport system permease subunit